MQVYLGNGIHSGERERDGLRSLWASGRLLLGAKQTRASVFAYVCIHLCTVP